MAETFSSLLQGFSVALTPLNRLWGFIGVMLGTFIGVLPGVGPALTVAMLMPLTVQLVAGDLPAVTSARLMAEVAALREAWPTAGPVPPSAITTSHAKHERALINPAGAEAARIGLAVG